MSSISTPRGGTRAAHRGSGGFAMSSSYVTYLYPVTYEHLRLWVAYCLIKVRSVEGSGESEDLMGDVRATAVAVSEETAVSYVIEAVESAGSASREDFDIDAIVTVSRAVAQGWDLSSLEQETFWRIVAQFMR